MFSWLEDEILGLPKTDYLVLLGVLAAVFAYLVYSAYVAFKRYRFMDGTATSKVRSAAQGHVELKGLGECMPNDTIQSPFSNSRCIWYHCTIDKKGRSGKRTTWTNISDECSSHLFNLVDETGSCIIDPDEAHVIPESDLTWYGDDTGCRRQPPKRVGWLSLRMGNYRFRERLIRPAGSLYALGWFRTVHSDPSVGFISTQVDDLVRQWKLQPQRYLRDFDFDQNRKIQRTEWKAIRAAARKQVLAKINNEKREHHVMSRPQEKSQPYIISATREEDLVARKKLKAYTTVAAGLLIFSALVIMFSIRTPLPV
jgi:hypothetical protein